MNDIDTNKLIVKEWSVLRIIFLLALAVGVGVGVVALKELRDVRSRAYIVTPKASPFTPRILPPVTNLSTPYVRLFTQKQKYGLNDVVPVEVYINTGSKESMVLTLVITYDGDSLEFDEKNIEQANLFKTIDIGKSEKGRLEITFFIVPQVGHKAIATNTDTQVAILPFKTNVLEKKEVRVDLEFNRGSSEKTLLMPYSLERSDKLENLLQSVQGVLFDVGQ